MNRKVFDKYFDEDDIGLFARFTNYVRVVLHRTRRDYLKQERKAAEVFSLEEMMDEHGFDIVDSEIEQQIDKILNWEFIKANMKWLTINEMTVIMAVYFQNMSQAECARKMGLSGSRVYALKRSALIKLKQAMEERKDE